MNLLTWGGSVHSIGFLGFSISCGFGCNTGLCCLGRFGHVWVADTQGISVAGCWWFGSLAWVSCC